MQKWQNPVLIFAWAFAVPLMSLLLPAQFSDSPLERVDTKGVINRLLKTCVQLFPTEVLAVRVHGEIRSLETRSHIGSAAEIIRPLLSLHEMRETADGEIPFAPSGSCFIRNADRIA